MVILPISLLVMKLIFFSLYLWLYIYLWNRSKDEAEKGDVIYGDSKTSMKVFKQCLWMKEMDA